MSELINQGQLLRNFQFSEEEQQEFSAKIWELLKWQSAKYNGIDSTSLPVEKAQELMASMVYTIMFVATEDNLDANDLLHTDFKELLVRGQKLLTDKSESLRQKWNALCADIPEIHNVYYMDTLKNIGLFFERYELYYSAHDIPCSIDYPLLAPIPEDIKGISYIDEYIRRLEIENRLIRFYDIETIRALLSGSNRDYKGDFFNLCEPVAVNAIARNILDKDIRIPVISKDDIETLQQYFEGKSRDELLLLIGAALIQLGASMGYDEDEISYFNELVQSLVIRVEIAAKTENLSNIFHEFTQ